MLTKSPSCLDNYIVFYNGCYDGDKPEPTSGYYIENLEGLTLENVAMISPELLISATQTIKEKMLFAASIVESRLKAILNSRGIKLNTVGKLYSACVVQSAWDLSMPFDKGIRISKKWLNSPQSRIFVDAVRFKSKISGPSVIKVKDLLGNDKGGDYIDPLEELRRMIKETKLSIEDYADEVYNLKNSVTEANSFFREGGKGINEGIFWEMDC